MREENLIGDRELLSPDVATKIKTWRPNRTFFENAKSRAAASGRGATRGRPSSQNSGDRVFAVQREREVSMTRYLLCTQRAPPPL